MKTFSLQQGTSSSAFKTLCQSDFQSISRPCVPFIFHFPFTFLKNRSLEASTQSLKDTYNDQVNFGAIFCCAFRPTPNQLELVPPVAIIVQVTNPLTFVWKSDCLNIVVRKSHCKMTRNDSHKIEDSVFTCLPGYFHYAAATVLAKLISQISFVFYPVYRDRSYRYIFCKELSACKNSLWNPAFILEGFIHSFITRCHF